MKRTIFLISLWFCLSVFIPVSVSAETTNSAEVDIMNKAIQAGIDGNYRSGGAMLEEFSSKHPDAVSEDIFNKLEEFYDKDLMDYAKAVEYYQKYLDKFPKGRFADIYSKRLNYLKENQKGWDLLKRYNTILSTYNQRSQAENIKIMEAFMHENPGSFLTPDANNWLAYQYFQIPEYTTAIKYIKDYFSSISETQRNSPEEAANYVLYAEALSKLHKFTEAKDILYSHVNFDDAGIRLQFSEGISWVIKEQRIWYGLLATIGFLVLCAAFLLFLRFWREKNWLQSFRSLLGWSALLILTAAAFIITVYITKHLFFKVFVYLAIGQVLALAMIRLLGLVSYKINRIFYYGLCLLIIAAFIYIPFYLADNLAIFWTPIEYM